MQFETVTSHKIQENHKSLIISFRNIILIIVILAEAKNKNASITNSKSILERIPLDNVDIS